MNLEQERQTYVQELAQIEYRQMQAEREAGQLKERAIFLRGALAMLNRQLGLEPAAVAPVFHWDALGDAIAAWAGASRQVRRRLAVARGVR